MRSAYLLLAFAAVPVVAGDWPQFMGPNRDGTSPETKLLNSWPKNGPQILWTHKIGEGFSSPVVKDGKVIVLYRTGNDEVVECLAAKGGKQLWKHTRQTSYRDGFGKGDGPRSTPLIHGDKVVTFGADGYLQCLTFKDGKKVWAKDLNKLYKAPKNFFGVGTTPIVEGKNLLVNVGGEKAGIVALALDSGKEAWTATEDGASYASPIAATIDGVRQVLFFTRQGLVSLDPANGKERFRLKWRARNNASVNAATPLLLGKDRLFLSASYQTGAILLKVSKDGVKEVWKGDNALSCHFNTPVAVGKQLFGIHGRQEGENELRCIDWADGKKRWSKEGLGCASIIAVDGKLLILTESGDLILAEANATKYVEKARATILGNKCRAHAALSEGCLFARDDTKLVCVKVK